MRTASLATAIMLMGMTGCGSDEEPQVDFGAVFQRLSVVESQLKNLEERIDSCRTSIRKIDEQFVEAQFHVDQVPQLLHDLDRVKVSVASASKILSGISLQGDQLVIRGLVVADSDGHPRCQVSPSGMTIVDKGGRRVCEIEYDQSAEAMTVSLHGRKTKSVALYAGRDRVAIGAYGKHESRLVGWAATVTPEGKVTAGRAGR